MDIEQRLMRVERQCRVYRGILVLAGLGLLALVSLGLDHGEKITQDVVRTRRLEVVNKEGRVVGSMFSGFQNGGVLILRKSDDAAAVVLDTNLHAGGTVVLFNDWGEPAIQMHPTRTGDGLLMIKSRGHHNRAYYTSEGMQKSSSKQ